MTVQSKLPPTRTSAPGDTVAFIVRVWYEAVNADGQATVWRGSVERVAQPNQRVFFEDLDSIADYIRQHAGLNGARPPAA